MNKKRGKEELIYEKLNRDLKGKKRKVKEIKRRKKPKGVKIVLPMTRRKKLTVENRI